MEMLSVMSVHSVNLVMYVMLKHARTAQKDIIPMINLIQIIFYYVIGVKDANEEHMVLSENKKDKTNV